jgi:hypothetical protein
MSWTDDAKSHPDRHPSRHEVHTSLHAADETRIVDPFSNPDDAAPAPVGLDSADLTDKLLPDLLDELDHAGLAAALPDDHPGGLIEDHPKGLPARWTKA